LLADIFVYRLISSRIDLAIISLRNSETFSFRRRTKIKEPVIVCFELVLVITLKRLAMIIHNKLFFFLGYMLLAVGVFFFVLIKEPGQFTYLSLLCGVVSLAIAFRTPANYEP